MRPGAWSAAGFLGAGTPLANVLVADAELLDALGLTAEGVGRHLGDLLAVAAGSDIGRPSRAGDHDIELHRRRGFLTCPWAPEEFARCPVGAGSRATANQFLLLHRPTARRLFGFELSAHLIRDHAFFGGPGTPLRLDPTDVAEVLGLA